VACVLWWKLGGCCTLYLDGYWVVDMACVLVDTGSTGYAKYPK
jgi:hypothetical protein